MKILILKPSSLGDVIQALPVLRLIRRHLPSSQIYWWIEAGLAPILEGDPDLAGTIPFDRKAWAHPANWSEVARTVRWMRDQRFDWVIDLQSLLRSGIFAWLANGQLLAGLDERREGARGFYDIVARRATWHTHAADWYLSILPLLGVPVTSQFEWLPRRDAVAAGLEHRWNLSSHRWILLQPGARWLNKRWPLEHFKTLARELQARHSSHRLAVLGGKDDAPLGASIAEACAPSCLDLTGKLSLSEMIEMIRACDLMVTNDTGPMHVAAALRKSVVGLFGPTEPTRTGPYGQTGNVLRLELPCSPCMKPKCRLSPPNQCLTNLLPSKVLEKSSQLLRP